MADWLTYIFYMGGIAAWCVFAWLMRRVQRIEPPDPVCASCDCVLAGLAESGRCPKCGASYQLPARVRENRPPRRQFYIVAIVLLGMAALFASIPAVKTLIVEVGFNGRSLGVSLADVFGQLFVTGSLLKSGAFFCGPLIVLIVCAERAWGLVPLRRLLCILVGGFAAAWMFMLAIAVQASGVDGPAQFGALIMMSMMGVLPMGWGMLAGWLVSLLPWFNRPSCVNPPADSSTSSA